MTEGMIGEEEVPGTQREEEEEEEERLASPLEQRTSRVLGPGPSLQQGFLTAVGEPAPVLAPPWTMVDGMFVILPILGAHHFPRLLTLLS